ncbi:MAG TPA: FtsX-like permease family protein, partial [Longimicrobiales bacterium]|nr:FtsX-like permease family protein [Longimicrobiales bacterium]
MRLPFAVTFARREGRAGLRRTGIHFAAIALGVAALVSLHGFRADVEEAVHRESRTLMGADLRLGGRTPLPDTVRALVDSLEGAGARTARVTALLSMVLAPGEERARLLQLRSPEGPYPFYGRPRVRPREAWDAMIRGRGALVEPPALIQLGIEVGDTVRIGTVEVPVLGTVDDLPMEVALQTASGPRILVSPDLLERTGLVTFGSMVWYWTYLALPDPADAEEIQARYRDLFRALDVDDDSAAERAGDLTEGLGDLSRFLALVGVVALILGGIGVGSAVHAYVSGKVETVAVLRCIGATQGRVFGAYLLQAGALSLLGAGVGGAAGVGVQRLLPGFLAPVLPVTVVPTLRAGAVAAGVAVGVWTGVVFALLPLLGVRGIPPLRALRHGFDGEEAGPSGGDRALRAAVLVLLGATVVALCLWQAPSTGIGFAFAGGLAGATALLAASAWALGRSTRALLPRGASYPVRQGISNLFRPRNQTLAVTLTIGGGAFLLAGILGVQDSLRARFSVEDAAGRPNLLLFDVQPDQRAGVVETLEDGGASVFEAAPIVPSRIAAIGGRAV